MRIDVFLVKNGYVKSREKAKYLVESGGVKLNNKIVQKVSAKVDIADNVEVLKKINFVNRSGEKLNSAIGEFRLDLSNSVALDIGASSGGFTDCMISHGAKKIYAVDVGTGQLDEKLRNDKRVVCFENTDIRNFNPASVKEPLDFIVIDVSFISLKYIIPLLSKFAVKDKTQIVALIKPQFEVGKRALKKGIVQDEKIVNMVLDDLRALFEKNGIKVHDIIKSPLKGKEGNQEYLLYGKA